MDQERKPSLSDLIKNAEKRSHNKETIEKKSNADSEIERYLGTLIYISIQSEPDM